MNKKLKSALALLIHPNLILISIILVGLTWLFGGDIVKAVTVIFAIILGFAIFFVSTFLFSLFIDWYDQTFNDDKQN